MRAICGFSLALAGAPSFEDVGINLLLILLSNNSFVGTNELPTIQFKIDANSLIYYSSTENWQLLYVLS